MPGQACLVGANTFAKPKDTPHTDKFAMGAEPMLEELASCVARAMTRPPLQTQRFESVDDGIDARLRLRPHVETTYDHAQGPTG